MSNCHAWFNEFYQEELRYQRRLTAPCDGNGSCFSPQHQRFLQCPESSNLPPVSFRTEGEELRLQEPHGLRFSSAYQVCVTAGNAGGNSTPSCRGVTTPPRGGECNWWKNAELELQITRKEFVGWLLIR